MSVAMVVGVAGVQLENIDDVKPLDVLDLLEPGRLKSPPPRGLYETKLAGYPVTFSWGTDAVRNYLRYTYASPHH
jgi:hypothetical protein